MTKRTRRKIDAFMTFPPWAQELRAQATGHVILNSAVVKWPRILGPVA